MTKKQDTRPHADERVATLLHYANAAPTETTWRGIVIGSNSEQWPAGAEYQTPFGVRSLQEFETVQNRLTSVLDRVRQLESPYADDAAALAGEITERAAPKFGGWKFSPLSDKLFELWDTETTSFEEFLFFTLALVLRDIPFRRLHRCEACSKFFFGDSERDRKFCSNTCRSRTTVKKLREMRGSTSRLPSTGSPPRTSKAGRNTTRSNKEPRP